MKQPQRSIRTYVILLILAIVGVGKVLWTVSDIGQKPAASGSEESDEFVRRFAISHNRKLLATISFDGTRQDILVRELDSRSEVARLTFRGIHPESVAFHPKRDAILATYEDGRVVIWELGGSQPEPIVYGQLSGSGAHAVFSADGTMFAAGTTSGAIGVWDYSSRQLQRTLTFAARVFAMDFDADGQTLLAAGLEGGLCVWDLRSGSQRSFHGAEGFQIRAARFSRDCKHVLTGGLDGNVRLWNVADGTQKWSRATGERSLTCIEYTPDGRLGVCGTVQGNVLLVSLDATGAFPVVRELGSPISHVTFTNDGRLHSSSFRSDVVSGLWAPRIDQYLAAK